MNGRVNASSRFKGYSYGRRDLFLGAENRAENRAEGLRLFLRKKEST